MTLDLKIQEECNKQAFEIFLRLIKEGISPNKAQEIVAMTDEQLKDFLSTSRAREMLEKSQKLFKSPY